MEAEQDKLQVILSAYQIQKMQEAKAFLEENFTHPPTIPALAHLVGTNENHLKKHFKAVFNETVYGYIKNYRIEKARELLRNGELSIAQIADQLGYKHATHFTAAFKKNTGELPKEFQKLTR